MHGRPRVRDLERDLRGLNLCGRSLHQQEYGRTRNDPGINLQRRYRSRSNSRRPRSASVGSCTSNRSRRRESNSSYWSLNDFKNHIRSRYDWQTSRLVSRYIEASEISAEVVNSDNYLRRCRDTGLIPEIYWVTIPGIRHTRDVTRLLDKCSFQLMCKDIEINRGHRQRVEDNLKDLDKRLSQVLSQKDLLRLIMIVKQHRSILFDEIRNRQRKEYNNLRKAVMDYEQQLKKKKTSPDKLSRGPSDLNDSTRENGSEKPRGGRVRRRTITSLSSNEGSAEE